MKSFTIITLVLFFITSCNKTPNVKIGFAEVSGTKLYYEVAGKGEPIIFIHGNFGDHRHWDFQFSSLANNYKVIRYDLRGFGKSAVPKSDELYSDWDDLKALLDFLEIEKAHICGLSGGSSAAVDFALEFPQKCLSLIPIGPWAGGYGSGDFKSPNADSLFVGLARIDTILKSQGIKSATDYIWKGNNCLARSVNNQRTLDSLIQMGYDYSFWFHLNSSPEEYLSPSAMSRLNEIKLPALIITAENDLMSCKEIADIMEKGISGSRKVVMKEAGHIMNMDKPEEFNRYISDFIDNLK
jgi:pimeloyl-ACP methyl ester carboxylesterase